MYLIILAAGKSKRIGRDKVFIKYKGKTFIENIVDKLNSKVDKIIIVTGIHNHERIKKLFIDKKNIITLKNTKYHLGQIFSIKLATKYVKKYFIPKPLLIHLVDQPHIKKNTYLKMLKEFKKNDKYINIPTFYIKKEKKYKRGHPVIIPPKYFKLLMKNPYHCGLHWLIHHKNVKTNNVIVNDKAVIEDIDTKKDLKLYLS
ncbi:MAG: NTP transferase domain-containing protein [Elusimicrobiales bacterium]|nr:NTP transferase domain-containing protein [Elusimicrobiales bacterium]